ncbi:MAG: hypothetical protein H8Z69_00790 [Nanohaloarchaea archaeon]|nr:hypothetical protein [Candidatus Nanohaloarchaea archaeon]
MALIGLFNRWGESGQNKFTAAPQDARESIGKEQPSFEELMDKYIDTEKWEFDPHVHSSYSDGENIKQIIETAEKMGIQIGVADHSRKDADAVILYTSNGNKAYEIAMNGEVANLEDQLKNLNDSIALFSNNIDEELEEHFNDFDGYLEGIREYYRDALEIGIPEPTSEVPDDTIRQLSRDSIVKAAGEENLATLGQTPKEALKPATMSIEKDYESWLDNGIEKLLNENDLDHAVISVHNLPEGFIQENMHDKQTQYIRKADLSHLEDEELEEAVERYQADYMRAILEMNNTSHLEDNELERLEGIYSKYSEEDDFHEYASNQKSSDTPIIHSHWDLILTNPSTRDHVREEYMDDILDFAEITDATLEANGRILGKLRKEFSDAENFYAPEDAEMFTRKLASRSKDGGLEYVASTDAHSSWEMFRQHLMLQPIIEEYGEPLKAKEFYSRT